MPLPPNVDVDKLVAIALDGVRAAISGWLKGAPREEPALLNRLTQQLSRTRRGCDVGVDKRVVVRARVATLHRRGPGSTDLHGADFAITVFSEPDGYTKTALLQLKKGIKNEAELERRQLQDSLKKKELAIRSFIAYVDEQRFLVRLQETNKLLASFDSNQATKKFSTKGWTPLSEWIIKWLSCDIGPMSEAHGDGSLEEWLKEYETNPTFLAGSDEPLAPAAWLIYGFLPDEVNLRNTGIVEYFFPRPRRR